MRFHEGKGATSKPICPWSTGHTPHLRVVVIWVINWDILYKIPQRGHGYCSVASTRRGSVLRGSQHHACCRGGYWGCWLLCWELGSWSRGAATLCWPSPPIVPGVCLSPVACWLLLLPVIPAWSAHHFISSSFPLSFHLILVLVFYLNSFLTSSSFYT